MTAITVQIDGLPLQGKLSVRLSISQASERHNPGLKRVIPSSLALWARWIRHGSAHKNILQVYVLTRDLFISVRSARLPLFFPLALLLYILWISQ